MELVHFDKYKKKKNEEIEMAFEALEILKGYIPIQGEVDEFKRINAKVLMCVKISDFIKKNFPKER